MPEPIDLEGPARIIVARLEERLRFLAAELGAVKVQVDQWRARAQAAEAREAKKDQRIHDLERKLTFFENPHTPPSQPTLKPNNRDASEPEPKKRGKPPGSHGATRTRPPIDRTVDVEAPNCPNCGGTPGSPVGVDVHPVTERMGPAPVTTTQYNLATYQCRCGHLFTATAPDVPQEGVWGPLMLTHFSLLSFLLRGRLRRCVAFLLDQDGIRISPKGYWDALQRVSRACKPGYANIRESLRGAVFVYVDETMFKVNGKRWWLWTFRDPLGHVLVVIRPGRGNGVVREILGDDPPPLVVDGHKAYEFASILQRCWQHLLREGDEVREAGPVGVAFAQALYDVFRRLKATLSGKMDASQREARKEAFDRELEALVKKYEDVPGIQKAVTYLRNGFGSWTTCLRYPATDACPAMEPTNNLSEQAIREHAVLRKLIGSFHSPEGAQNYQYVASLFATWRFQVKNPAHELVEVLRRNLCMGSAGAIPPPVAVPAV